MLYIDVILWSQPKAVLLSDLRGQIRVTETDKTPAGRLKPEGATMKPVWSFYAATMEPLWSHQEPLGSHSGPLGSHYGPLGSL